MIINCEEIRNNEIEKLKDMKIDGLKAVFVQVGDNQASNVYVRNKLNLCKEANIEAKHLHFDESITEEELIKEIHRLNEDNSVHGIMVQLPVPKHINEEAIINAIDYKKDIDGFTDINKGKLMIGDRDGIIACTPQGIMTILEHQGINLRGKNAVIVGRSNIVGKPMAQLLINNSATVTVCNSTTDKHYLGELISRADIFISAIGQANYFDKKFFDSVDIPLSRLKNITAIDVGINRNEENKLCGDISRELYDYWGAITPVPKGCGLTTVMTVIQNIYKCAKMQGIGV